jgi:dTDP-4-dehydrorhamnose reductase
MKLLLTGGAGLVGQALIPLLKNTADVLAPERTILDILNRQSVKDYIRKEQPRVIIHLAAYVNAGEAEKERGNTKGMCYRTNVDGTKALVDEGNAVGAFVVYISTGSVFHGNKYNPGPFEIDDSAESHPDHNGWYGYTKYLGELTRPDAIVRISHPIVSHGGKDDYLQKILRLYDENTLFPLFPDQYFPLTDAVDLYHSIHQIITYKKRGIFHVASPDLTSPYEMTIYALQLLGRPIDERIKKLSIEEFYEQGNSPLRFAQYSAICSKKTEELLRMKFAPWKEIVRKTL